LFWRPTTLIRCPHSIIDPLCYCSRHVSGVPDADDYPLLLMIHSWFAILLLPPSFCGDGCTLPVPCGHFTRSFFTVGTLRFTLPTLDLQVPRIWLPRAIWHLFCALALPPGVWLRRYFYWAYYVILRMHCYLTIYHGRYLLGSVWCLLPRYLLLLPRNDIVDIYDTLYVVTPLCYSDQCWLLTLLPYYAATYGGITHLYCYYDRPFVYVTRRWPRDYVTVPIWCPFCVKPSPIIINLCILFWLVS